MGMLLKITGVKVHEQYMKSTTIDEDTPSSNKQSGNLNVDSLHL